MKRLRLRSSALGCIAILTLALMSVLPNLPSTSIALAAGTISGTVYRDYNASGARDAVEPQFAGITVIAFDSSGVVRGSATTVRCSGASTGVDTNGIAVAAAAAAGCTGSDSGANYSLTVTGTGPYRIEFSGWPAFVQPSAMGTANGTTVQFVPDGNSSNINLGFNNPAQFCENNPDIATSCYLFGDQVSGPNNGGASVRHFPYTSGTTSAAGSITSGNQPGGAYINGAYTLDAITSQTGAVWGMAYQRDSTSLFLGSFMKRHTGFGPTNDAGTIYRIDQSAALPNASAYVTLNAGPNQHTPTNTAANAAEPDYFDDIGAFNSVGNTGLGDLELSDDEATLYAVNMFDGKVYAINIGVPALAVPPAPTAITPPTPTTGVSAAVGCAAANVRPGALKYHDGVLYVGLTCTGPAIANLRAYVYRYDVATSTFSTNPVAEFALNYPRGCTSNGGTCAPAAWQPWVTDANSNPTDDLFHYATWNQYYKPQPWLLDIEIDEYGFMALNFADRAGHQLGNSNAGADAGPVEGVSAGDLLRLAPGAGTWTIENNASVGTGLPGGATTSGAGTNEGPGGGEYYYQDRYGTGHNEIYLAGAAQVYGKGEIVTSAFDPAMDGNYRAGGLVMTSHSTGRRTRSIELFGRDAAGTFGKAAGIGDIEVMCDSAPIEIGNRVWRDDNANGIQDAGEPGLAGVTVQLYDNAGTLVVGATAATDANGNYVFSSDTTRTNTASAKYSLALLPNIAYQIRVATAQASLTGFGLTGSNTDASANGDARDSDATLAGGNAVISLTTGAHGANNHTYDFGFTRFVSVGNRIWWDTNNNSVQDGGELPIAGVRLELFFDADTNGTIDVAEQTPIAVTTSDASGLYLFTQRTDASGNPLATPVLLLPGTYAVGIAASNFAAGQPLAGAYSSATTANVSGALSETAAPDPDGVASDTDDNGTKQTSGFYSGGVLSLPVTLTYGGEPTVESPDADPNPSGRPDANDNQTVDFGFYTLQLGSQVWRDADNSGTINAADGATPGIANVRVRLFAADGTTEIAVGPDGMRGTADDALGGVLTDASGNYRFLGLAAGDYIVEVDTSSVALTDYASSTGAGQSATPNDNLDNDDNGTVLAATTVRSTAVTLTPNAPGAQNNNVITAAGGSTYDPTIDFGFYTMSLGNLVWGDANNNGAFDAGETPLANVIVNLLDSGGALLDSTTTNAGGHYLFSGLAAGDYIVELDASNFTVGGAYPGYTSSTGTIGAASGTYEPAADPDTNTTDSRDNGSNAAGGMRSGMITIVAGNEPTSAVETGGNTLTDPAPDSNSNLTVDFGLFAPVSLGNRVWVDANNNGTFDGSELAVSDGVQVNLYYDANGDGAISGGETTAIRTTTTSGGLYLFDNLVPGNYMVELDASNFSGAGALVGYTSSTGTVGAATGPVEAAPDADADPSDTDDNGTLNGTLGAGGSIRSALVTLTDGSEPTGENPDNDTATPDLNENLTVDFGVFQPAQLGDRVWYDANHNGVQDGGEIGVQNVTVTLYDSSNVLIATTTTDASGNYQFTNLTPGSYYVAFSSLPVGYVFTGQDTAIATDMTDSDADSISGQTGSYTLVAGDSNQTVDAGIYNDVRASLGDVVWYDTNENGVQDVSENGVPGVTVDLYQVGTATPIATTTTIADGSYLFSNLLEGDYYVQFTPPAGYTLTGKDLGGNDATDSDADTITHQTIPTHLDPGENDLTWDAGMFYSTVALGNRVWEDSDNDGVYDAGEPGISGATVTMYRDSNNDGTPDGAAIGTTTTDANGFYLFNGLTPDTYIVEVTPPAGYISSSGTNGAATGPYEGAATPDPDTDIDADDNGTTSAGVVRSQPITLTRGGEPAGETTALPDPDTNTPDFNSNLTIDFGFYRPLSLGNLVWHDVNDNGVVDGSEQGISGVIVMLYDASNALVATTTTDASGNYLFTNLAPGDYTVEVTTPSGFVSSTNISSSSDPNNSTDSDDNGVLVNATTVRAATITLTTGGEPSDDPGQPAGNANRNTTVDFGFYQPLSLGNLVWGDSDNNGVVNGSESGIDGVTANLYRDANGNGLIDAGEFVATQTTSGGGLYLFTSLRPGDYIVELPAGNFTVGQPLAHYASSTGGSSEPATDPDNNTNDDDNGTAQAGSAVLSAPVTLTSGGEPITDGDADANSNLSVDFGFYPLASLGDYVWLDTNKDGIQDKGESGVAGVNVQLYQPGLDNLAGTGDDVLVATTTTGASGDYQFLDLVPGDYFVQFNLPSGYAYSPQDATGDTTDSDADTTTGRTVITTLLPGENDPNWDAGMFFTASLGDRVWLDQNANGIQDAGEPGLPGVIVTLYTSAGTPVGAPATTDANGNYAFPNLAPGDYYVVVTPPVGYVITPTNQGADDTADSDADSTGTLATTTITPSENDPTWDAGLYQPVSLGNLVWSDYNNNGLVDGSESGIDGVVVNLYRDANGNGQIDAGEFVATQTTSGGGQYLFPNLVPGSYLVQIDPVNFSGAGVLVGYAGSTGSIGTNVSAVGPYEPAADPDNDIDDDDNGSAVYNQGIVSAPITLTSGGEPTTDGDSDPNSNLTVDFGVFQPASLGSIVWYDTNKDGVRDLGEAGVPGVTVTLYDSSGNPVATTTTDANGGFQFTNLVPGSYSVGFGNLPPGYIFTTPDQGSNDAADSDVDPTTGMSGLITLVPGQNNPTVNAGIVTVPTAISLASFTATRDGDQVVVRWVTTAEINTWGFHLYRSADGQRASATRVTPTLIPGQGRGQGGASYSWIDTEAAAGVTYTYWLVETEIGGATNEYGPATASARVAGTTYRLFMPLAVR